jgi:hypothetical protein
MNGLNDPERRAALLARLQDYQMDPGATDWERRLLALRNAARDRPVRAAIDRVGRIQAYPVIQ